MGIVKSTHLFISSFQQKSCAICSCYANLIFESILRRNKINDTKSELFVNLIGYTGVNEQKAK